MSGTIILFLTLGLAAMPVLAMVMKCVKLDSSIYYQDRPCAAESDIQTELNCYNKPADEDELKKIQHDLQQYRKLITKKQKRNLKRKSLAAKKQAAHKRRHLRMKAKCEKITQEIDRVSQRQRTGYNIVQGIALERKLNDYKNQRRKYCLDE